MIIPVDEVAYAACNSPTMNDQPSGQPELASKWPNTQAASRRPSLATARMVMASAIMPANVQNIANV